MATRVSLEADPPVKASLQMTAAPADSLTATSRGTLSQNRLAKLLLDSRVSETVLDNKCLLF